MNSESKKCTKCGEVKPIELFPKCENRCKSCKSAHQSAWRAANQEKVREYRKWWEKANPEKVRAMSKKARAIERSSKNRKTDRLTAAYVAQRLGIPVADCTPELIELKREQLRIHRLTKQLKQEIQK